MADGCIELIARGVLIGARGVLLCRAVGKDYTYLPGGHIEFGEPATNALTRELQEELGLKVKAAVNLLPRPLRALIPQWTRGKHMPWSSDVRE